MFLKLFGVFCPHIAEELWEKIGNKGFISLEKWPVADEKKIDEKLEKEEEMLENLVSDINNVLKIVKSKNVEVSKVFVYVLPKEKEVYNKSLIKKKTGLGVKVYAVNDTDKYDPGSKSGKAKLGKPAIYLE